MVKKSAHTVTHLGSQLAALPATDSLCPLYMVQKMQRTGVKAPPVRWILFGFVKPCFL